MPNLITYISETTLKKATRIAEHCINVSSGLLEHLNCAKFYEVGYTQSGK